MDLGLELLKAVFDVTTTTTTRLGHSTWVVRVRFRKKRLRNGLGALPVHGLSACLCVYICAAVRCTLTGLALIAVLTTISDCHSKNSTAISNGNRDKHLSNFLDNDVFNRSLGSEYTLFDRQ